MANALQPTLGGTSNAFVDKIAPIAPSPVTTASPLPGPNSYGWNNTSVTVALNSTDNPAVPGSSKSSSLSAGPRISDCKLWWEIVLP